MLSVVLFGASGIVSSVNFFSSMKMADKAQTAREVDSKMGMRYITGTVKTDKPIASGSTNFLTLKSYRYSMWRSNEGHGKSSCEVRTTKYEDTKHEYADAYVMSDKQKQNIKNLMEQLHSLYYESQPTETEMYVDTAPIANLNVKVAGIRVKYNNSVKYGTETHRYGIPEGTLIVTILGHHNGQQFTSSSKVIIRKDMTIDDVREELILNANRWHNMIYGSVVCGIVCGILETVMSGGVFGLCRL